MLVRNNVRKTKAPNMTTMFSLLTSDRSTRAASTTAENVEAQFDTNFKGPVRMSAAVVPHMLQQQEEAPYGQSKIINISSAGGLTALPYMSLYSASKAALSMYSDSLRMELKRLGLGLGLLGLLGLLGDNRS